MRRPGFGYKARPFTFFPAWEAAARAFASGRRANRVRTWVRKFAPGAIWGKPCQYCLLA